MIKHTNISLILIKRLLYVLVLTSVCACTDIFGDMNIDPLNPEFSNPNDNSSPGDADLMMPAEISAEELALLKESEGQIPSTFKILTYEGLYNDYQRTTNLSHDIFAGYFANNNPSFMTSTPNYVYTDGFSARRWDHFYKERCKEYGQLARTFWYVDRDKYRNAFYITRIYFAYLVSQMTDTYGPMPVLAYVKGFSAPDQVPYQSQERVYDIMFKLLTESVDSIRPNNGGFKFESEDRHFQGDEVKWLRFANTLRLRLALRISNVDPARAAKEGEAALAAQGGLMQSADDNLKTIPKYAPVAQGGDDAGGDENIYALCSFAWLDVCMSKDIETVYKTQSSQLDPRCGVLWFRPTPKSRLEAKRESTADFNGCEIGSDDVTRESNKFSVLRCNIWDGKLLDDKYWFGYSRESIWMSYAESRFLLAEAALRGWAGVSGDAQSHFEEGIRASFAYYGLGGEADKYISGLTALSDPVTNPFLRGDKEATLEQIIIQKWLAIFPNGNEAWAEFRRTDYPRLMNHKGNSSSDVALNKFIKRLRFPNSEFDYNNENLPKDFIRQDMRLWWDISDTNDGSGVRLEPNNFR